MWGGGGGKSGIYAFGTSKLKLILWEFHQFILMYCTIMKCGRIEDRLQRPC